MKFLEEKFFNKSWQMMGLVFIYSLKIILI